MRKILQIISYLGLIVTLAPGFLVLSGNMAMDQYKIWVLVGTGLWFATAPFWINKEKSKT